MGLYRIGIYLITNNFFIKPYLMKIIFTQLQRRSASSGKRNYFAPVVLSLTLLLLLSSSALFAGSRSSMLLIASQKNQQFDFLRQLQLDVFGFYWNAQNGAGETQECSVETTLLVSVATATLEIDPFDPLLGMLTEVEIVVEGTLMINAEEELATGTEYMLVLNSTLKYQLPGSAQDTLAVSNNYKQRTYNEYVAQQGFQANGWAAAEARKTFTTQLNQFQGTDKIQIPIEGKDLVDFQQGQSHVTSTLKVKACVTYRYQ